MKRWSEGKAAVMAIVTAAATLVGTFGFAEAMRTMRVSLRVPDWPKTVHAEPNPKVAMADATYGRHLFLMNCAHCHGDDARGDEGPDLHGLRKSDARIHQVITAGIKGEMPSFGSKLSESDVRALTTYLRTLTSSGA